WAGCAREGTGVAGGGRVVCSTGGAASIGARSMTTGPGRPAGAVAFRQLSTAVAIAPCTSSTIPALSVQYRRFAWFVVANAVIRLGACSRATNLNSREIAARKKFISSTLTIWHRLLQAQGDGLSLKPYVRFEQPRANIRFPLNRFRSA